MEENTLPAEVATLINDQQSYPNIDMRYEFTSSPEEVFAVIGDLEGITRYFPLIYHATVSGADSRNKERVCSIRGMGKVSEKIVWWSKPAGFAYEASGTFVPIKDHLGVITLSNNGNGGTVLEWKQFFKTRFGPLGWIFPVMMKFLMGKAIKNIRAIA